MSFPGRQNNPKDVSTDYRPLSSAAEEETDPGMLSPQTETEPHPGVGGAPVRCTFTWPCALYEINAKIMKRISPYDTLAYVFITWSV